MKTGGFGLIALMWVLVGVYAHAALTHIQFGLRRPRKRLQIEFGVLAGLASYTTAAATVLLSASVAATYETATHQYAVGLCGLFIVLPWFVRDYIGHSPRWPAMTISGTYLLVLLASLWLPHSALLASSPQLYDMTLLWGETITRTNTPPHPWLAVLLCAHFLAVGYCIYAVGYATRQRFLGSAIGLAIAIAPLTLSMLLNILIGLGFIEGSFTRGSLGIMFMVLAMSIVLSESLRRSSRQLQTILDNVPAMVYLKQRDGRYLFVNRRFAEIFGLATDAILGRRDDELFAPPMAAARIHADTAALQSAQLSECEEAIMSPGTNVERTYTALRFALKNRRGEIYAVCGIATDVSERKAADDLLRESAANLERRVSRRTSELAQVNRELEAFVYSVSHDLRAPLTAINGFAELLIREHGARLDQNGNRYLTRIRDASIRMASIIQDLLGLSRVTQQTLDRLPIDLVPIAQNALKTLQEAEPARTVEVTLPATLMANGDAKMLALALTNLLGNAWKYSGKTATPRIEFGSIEQNGETVFYVRDNGAGFSPEHADRLFRPFVRLHADSEFPGTGIGLATVARIVARHGGQIWAEAKINAGATFFFTLPLPDDEVAADLESTQGGSA